MWQPVPFPGSPDQAGDDGPAEGCDSNYGCWGKRRKQLPYNEGESGQRNGCHCCTGGIGAHSLARAAFAMKTFFRLMLALVFLDEGCACGKDRGKSEKQAAHTWAVLLRNDAGQSGHQASKNEPDGILIPPGFRE